MNRKTSCTAALLALSVVTSSAQVFSLIHIFSSADGIFPKGKIVLSGNTIYGTTSSGLGNGVFSVGTDGTGFRVLHSFGSLMDDSSTNGAHPEAGLLLVGDKLYGTTGYGGLQNKGTVFVVNTNGGDFAMLRSFSGSDGERPQGGLILAGDRLYGTTSEGGNLAGGTLFSLNPDGSGFEVLHHFWSSDTDAANPMADLLLVGDTLYGTTWQGGPEMTGAIFSIKTNGTAFTVFTNLVGAFFWSDLTFSSNMLYGTARQSGAYGRGTVFSLSLDGSYSQVLHHFNLSDGRSPMTGVTVCGDTIYGATHMGGTNNSGVLFSMKTNGSDFKVLHYFSGPDGEHPWTDLVLSGNTLYGMTYSDSYPGPPGTVFKLDLATPVVQFVIQTNSTIAFVWNSIAGRTYQLQYSSNLSTTNWYDLGGTVTATNASLAGSDSIGPNSQRFYRVALLP